MLVIITGTLRPDKAVYRVKLSDTEERLKQYADSLKFLANCKKISKYVFCENSGALELLERLKNMAGDGIETEFLSFTGSRDAVQRGKGYGEGEILQYVWKHSKFLQQEEEFVKITGRIVVRNLDSVLQKMKPGINYFNSVRPLTREQQIDTKFYRVSKKSFEDCFLNAYTKVNDAEEKYLEHVYYEVIKDNKIKYRNFPEYPVYEGISGSTGVSYASIGWKYTVKNLLSKCNLYRNF